MDRVPTGLVPKFVLPKGKRHKENAPSVGAFSYRSSWIESVRSRVISFTTPLVYALHGNGWMTLALAIVATSTHIERHQVASWFIDQVDVMASAHPTPLRSIEVFGVLFHP